MRKNIVAGNWKMNNNLKEGTELAKEIVSKAGSSQLNCELILGTPFIHLNEVSTIIKNSNIFVSAQNCANKESGAYTGEISAQMIRSTGAEYVIIGHSERREYYGESNSILMDKTKIALQNGLKVIFCCGEVLEERESNTQFEVVKKQLEEGIFNLSSEEMKNIVIAYEPVWAIGTGKTASPEQAQEIHAFIRECLTDKYNEEIANQTSILYGGSCKPGNAKEIFANADVDGGLIGGASLKADDFIAIAQSF